MSNQEPSLVFKDLTCRLPYSVAACKPGGEPFYVNALEFDADNDDTYQVYGIRKRGIVKHRRRFNLSEVRPILRPLSDVFETITHRGEVLRVIDKILGVLDLDGYQGYYSQVEHVSKKDNFWEVIVSIWGAPEFRVSFPNLAVKRIHNDERIFTYYNMSREISELLDRYMIDHRDLIRDGQAIDVNDLKQNPYEEA